METSTPATRIQRLRRSAPTVLSAAALFIAIGGTAVALPGKSTVNSGDIKDNQVKTIDLKDGKAVSGDDVIDESLTGTDLLDGSVAGLDVTDESLESVDVKDDTLASADVKDESLTGADVANATIESADVAQNSLTADDLANNSVGSAELAPDAVTSGDVQDFSLGARDVGSDTGNTPLNYPVINAGSCSSKTIDPANDNGISDNVIAVSPGAGFGGLYSVATEVQNNQEFVIKICNVSNAAGDPDGANGAVYSWVMFEA